MTELREKIDGLLQTIIIETVKYADVEHTFDIPAYRNQILALIKEAGWVLLADDQTFPGFLTLGDISEMELLQAMRNADYKAGWRKMILT